MPPVNIIPIVLEVWEMPRGLDDPGHTVWVLPRGLGVPGHKVCVGLHHTVCLGTYNIDKIGR
jgi:hypothetical protein